MTASHTTRLSKLSCLAAIPRCVSRRGGWLAGSLAPNILDELHELGANLIREKLIALVVGVDAIALEHGVGETGGPRTVGDDDGGLRRVVRLHPAGDPGVDAFDGRVAPACWDQLVDLGADVSQNNVGGICGQGRPF